MFSLRRLHPTSPRPRESAAAAAPAAVAWKWHRHSGRHTRRPQRPTFEARALHCVRYARNGGLTRDAAHGLPVELTRRMPAGQDNARVRYPS
jgi:hypothetical protein